jgi:hypothetical protein
MTLLRSEVPGLKEQVKLETSVDFVFTFFTVRIGALIFCQITFWSLYFLLKKCFNLSGFIFPFFH